MLREEAHAVEIMVAEMSGHARATLIQNASRVKPSSNDEVGE